MKDMVTLNATDVRKDWSLFIDKAVREKPQFFKRTRDYLMLSDLNFMEALLSEYKYNAEKFVETDNSITISLKIMDLVENGETEDQNFLIVRCATERTFALEVPNNMKTALEANAWTWGLEANVYKPEIQT